MKYLLDTHALLWFLEDDLQLPDKIGKEIVNGNNKCFVSVASLWEIAIKLSIGKLSLGFPFKKFASYLSNNDIELIPIELEHLIQVSDLNLYHRDPFDRVIIAQGIVEKLTVITKDDQFKKYPVKIMWK